MKKLAFVLGVLLLSAVAYWQFGHSAEETLSYRFVDVERGDVEETVTSTGNLSPVNTVEVGTQVSGQVEEIFVNFNDHVTAGQLIARIDPTLLEQAVTEAQANIQRSQAELTHAQKVFERQKKLHERQVVTEREFEAAEYSLAVAEANYSSARARLERTKRDLSYSRIYAPVEGVVVERNVDVGQTVAASFSAPLLFLIAEDLSKMEILASVDESDIGRITEGQTARFTVQAYPDDVFYGTVRQVRLQSSTQENVVTYTVVIDVKNPDGRLLPGMTATVDFLVETARDVLKVANAALRFRPTEAMMVQLREARAESGVEDPVSRPPNRSSGRWSQAEGEAAFDGRPSFQGERTPRNSPRSNLARLWTVDADGKLAVVPVHTGISNGQSTVIEPIQGEIAVGDRIIAGVTEVGAQESGTSLFQRNEDRSPRRRMTGF